MKLHDTKYNFSITNKKEENKKQEKSSFAFGVFIKYVKDTKMRKEMEENNFWPALRAHDTQLMKGILNYTAQQQQLCSISTFIDSVTAARFIVSF